MQDIDGSISEECSTRLCRTSADRMASNDRKGCRACDNRNALSYPTSDPEVVQSHSSVAHQHARRKLRLADVKGSEASFCGFLHLIWQIAA